MKMFKYILMILIGFSIVSCEKQEIVPRNSCDNSKLPSMRAAQSVGVVVLGDEDDSDSENGGGSIVDPNDKEVDLDLEGETIVDPNDKEGDGKIVDPNDKDGVQIQNEDGFTSGEAIISVISGGN